MPRSVDGRADRLRVALAALLVIAAAAAAVPALAMEGTTAAPGSASPGTMPQPDRQFIGLVATGAAIGVLAVLTILSGFLLLGAIARGSAIEIESHWGGFGGGIGGWRVSESLSYLLATVAFGSLLTTSLWVLMREPTPPPPAAGVQSSSERGKSAEQPSASSSELPPQPRSEKGR